MGVTICIVLVVENGVFVRLSGLNVTQNSCYSWPFNEFKIN